MGIRLADPHLGRGALGIGRKDCRKEYRKRGAWLDDFRDSLEFLTVDRVDISQEISHGVVDWEKTLHTELRSHGQVSNGGLFTPDLTKSG